MDKKKTDIPQPPKFNLDDIPEPPKLELKVPETHEKKIDVPLPPLPLKKEEEKAEKNIPVLPLETKTEKVEKPKEGQISLPEPPAIQKEKKGFFGLFSAKKKEEPKKDPVSLAKLPVINEDTFKPKIAEPAKIETPKTLAPVINIEKKEEKAENIDESKKSFSEFLDTGSQLPVVLEQMPKPEEMPVWVEEGEHYMQSHIDDDLSNQKDIPLSEVSGIGPKREKVLRKAGIKTAQHLAKHDHKVISSKLKIPAAHAKKLVMNAKKISKLKTKLHEIPKTKKGENITDVIKELETERASISRMSPDDEKLIELDGHKDLILVLKQLEKKRDELAKLQTELTEKESRLSGHEDSYKRDMDYIDNLKRRLDHDVRERTQYLINLEKEYFQKAQKLAALKSELEIKERDLKERERTQATKETEIKKKLNILEDREITVVSKEKKLGKIMEQLDKQDISLKEKEDDLIKREAEYLKKLDTLENHEKSMLKSLQEKKASLEKKEKEISIKEDRMYKKQRNVDKETVAVQYAKNVIEEEKSKLIDDEFEQYLHDQLKGSANGIRFSDINTVQNLKVLDTGNEKNLYKLIESCRTMLKANKVNEAKVYYNQIRDRYYGMSFSSQQEKQDLHNQIRQLYDEISLIEIAK